MHADVVWYEKTLRSQLVEWQRRLHQAGLVYGVIVNGSACCDKTDLQWTNHTIERYRLLANDPAIKPDDYIVQIWMRYPTRYLPETRSGTLTPIAVQAGMRAN
jgi:hypothetical protein